MNIDTNKLQLVLRANNQHAAADAIAAMGSGIEGLCSTTGFVPREVGQLQRADGGSYDNCDDPLVARVLADYQSMCGIQPIRCLAKRISMAITLSSYAEVRDHFSINDLALQATGLVMTGTPSNGVGTTTFVAGFNVAPGQSILLKVQDYPLPFSPRCLWGMLAFNGGTDDANYRHVMFKAWVAPKSAAAGAISQTMTQWAPKRWIYGSEFRCGDGCREIPLRSYTGCTDVDVIGLNSTLYIQVDNLATATNSITGQQMVLRLGGFEQPCCDNCKVGNACGCGGHKH